MPILDNGKPLKTGRCPECGSNSFGFNPDGDVSSVKNANCERCGWVGSKDDLKIVKHI